MMKKNCHYIQPNIKVFKTSHATIMAASAIEVTENGEADAKAADYFMMEDEDEE